MIAFACSFCSATHEQFARENASRKNQKSVLHTDACLSRMARMLIHFASCSRSIAASLSIIAMLSSLAASASAQSKDMGRGFRDLGVAAPISNHRGMVCTKDGNGRNVVLALLMDHRGGYALLMIDAHTGKAEQFPMPFKAAGESVDSPYASILSRANKFYTHFNGFFVEFDPAKRAFTFWHDTAPQMAMAMTEDDKGVIWSSSYPQSGIVSFDPKTKAFKDYGQVFKQDWMQYPRCIAADDTGAIYFAIGAAASQILIFDPKTASVTPVLPEGERKKGQAYLYRDTDGKVYAQALKDEKEPWYELYKGAAKKLDTPHTPHPKPEIAGSQVLAYSDFPDGAKLKSCDLTERKLTVLDAKSKTPRTMSFDYTSDGAIVMGAIACPDGTITGGTTFPMRCFVYDPKTDKITNRIAHGQWNTTATRGTHLFAGGYPGGYLLDWNTTKPWDNTNPKNKNSNPAILTPSSDPDLHRPTHLFATLDGKTVIMAGTPQYGYTGGGLLFWDRESNKPTLLHDTDIIPDQSTESFVPLPADAKSGDGRSGEKILAGTTTSPGTGGIKKATEAQLYLMDLATRKIEWHAAVLPGAQEYTDLAVAPNGMVYGIADAKTFFVFDPAARKVVYQHKTDKDLGPSAGQQGPRAFVRDPKGSDDHATYALFRNGIVQIDPKSYELKLLAKPPVPIEAGGDYLDGRIYFVIGSHLWSYALAK
jgi:hypothetical protein